MGRRKEKETRKSKFKKVEVIEDLDEVEEDEEELDQVTSRMLTTLRVLLFTIVPIILFYLMEAYQGLFWLS